MGNNGTCCLKHSTHSTQQYPVLLSLNGTTKEFYVSKRNEMFLKSSMNVFLFLTCKYIILAGRIKMTFLTTAALLSGASGSGSFWIRELLDSSDSWKPRREILMGFNLSLFFFKVSKNDSIVTTVMRLSKHSGYKVKSRQVSFILAQFNTFWIRRHQVVTSFSLHFRLWVEDFDIELKD